MRLVCYARLHPSECRIANRGKFAVRTSRVAVCDAGAGGIYTFICHDEWRVIFDGWSGPAEDAVKEAVEDARQTWPLSRWVSPE